MAKHSPHRRETKRAHAKETIARIQTQVRFRDQRSLSAPMPLEERDMSSVENAIAELSDANQPNAALDDAHIGDIHGAFGTIRRGDYGPRQSRRARRRLNLPDRGSDASPHLGAALCHSRPKSREPIAAAMRWKGPSPR
jgi:hypothetical protein